MLPDGWAMSSREQARCSCRTRGVVGLQGMDKQTVIDDTRRWISSVVIGLQLCPFAQRVFQADLIRYVVTEAEDETTLSHDLAVELKFLATSSIAEVETTLLIHPRVLGDFLDYNDFLDVGERLVEKLGLRGTVSPSFGLMARHAGEIASIIREAGVK